MFTNKSKLNMFKVTKVIYRYNNQENSRSEQKKCTPQEHFLQCRITIQMWQIMYDGKSSVDADA
jgi:hypothetical protein